MAIPRSIGKDNLVNNWIIDSKTNVFDGSSNALVNAKVNIVRSEERRVGKECLP